MFTQEKIESIVKNALSRYKVDAETRQDLYQEGVLAVYEQLYKNPNSTPEVCSRMAKRAIHDYLNLKTKPVHVPTHRNTRKMASNPTLGVDMPLSTTEGWTRAVLDNTPVDIDDNQETEFYDLENIDALRKFLNHLDSDGSKLIRLRYFEGKTQAETAEIMGLSKQQVYLLEKKIFLDFETNHIS